MSAAWVAGSVRAHAMTRRRLGLAGARSLARAGSLGDAVDVLARSPYAPRVRVGDTLPQARHGVAATVLWNLRVLAGWLPASGAEMLRALAGWFEVANVDEHLEAIAGRRAAPLFELGTLATAWPLLAGTATPDELREALAASAWGDPRGATPREIQLWLRLSWADRISVRAPQARSWALSGAALLLARELLVRRDRLPAGAEAVATRLLGTAWPEATTVGALRDALPAAARWPLVDIGDARDLWLAEVRWWRRMREEARRLAGGSTFGPRRLVGAIGMLAADAWLVQAALEAAARGSGAREAFDALA